MRKCLICDEPIDNRHHNAKICLDCYYLGPKGRNLYRDVKTAAKMIEVGKEPEAVKTYLELALKLAKE